MPEITPRTLTERDVAPDAWYEPELVAFTGKPLTGTTTSEEVQPCLELVVPLLCSAAS